MGEQPLQQMRGQISADEDQADLERQPKAPPGDRNGHRHSAKAQVRSLIAQAGNGVPKQARPTPDLTETAKDRHVSVSDQPDVKRGDPGEAQ
jgi:hypothetical protein